MRCRKRVSVSTVLTSFVVSLGGASPALALIDYHVVVDTITHDDNGGVSGNGADYLLTTDGSQGTAIPNLTADFGANPDHVFQFTMSAPQGKAFQFATDPQIGQFLLVVELAFGDVSGLVVPNVTTDVIFENSRGISLETFGEGTSIYDTGGIKLLFAGLLDSGVASFTSATVLAEFPSSYTSVFQDVPAGASSEGVYYPLNASERMRFQRATLIDFAVESGDMNGDGALDDDDVNLFVLALTNRAAYNALYPTLDADVIGNVNQDEGFDLGDVGAFKTLLAGSAAAASAVPEPTAAYLLASGLLACGIFRRSVLEKRQRMTC